MHKLLRSDKRAANLQYTMQQEGKNMWVMQHKDNISQRVVLSNLKIIPFLQARVVDMPQMG